MPAHAPTHTGARARRVQRWPRCAAFFAVAIAVAFLGAPALAGVPARLVEGCGDWIVSAVVLELLSAAGFVVFFKLIFAARVSWRHGAPAGLRALAATTVLPAGGFIGPGVGAWSASTEKPSLAQLARSTVTFTLLSSAPAAVALATLGTLLWLGIPDGPHQAALTILPASVAAIVIGVMCLAGRSSRRRRERSPRRRRLSLPRGRLASAVGASAERPGGRLASAVGGSADGIADAEALLRAGDWKLVGSLAYFAFDGAVLWAAFHAYGHSPPIAVIAMGYLVGSLAGALPLPAGLGAVEGGLIGALALYGAPLAPAAAAVLLYRGISLSLPLALGAAGWMWSPATRATEGRRAGAVQGARARRPAWPRARPRAGGANANAADLGTAKAEA